MKFIHEIDKVIWEMLSSNMNHDSCDASSRIKYLHFDKKRIMKLKEDVNICAESCL